MFEYMQVSKSINIDFQISTGRLGPSLEVGSLQRPGAGTEGEGPSYSSWGSVRWFGLLHTPIIAHQSIESVYLISPSIYVLSMFYLSVYLISLSNQSVCESAFLSIYLSIYLSFIYLSIYLSIFYLSIYLSIDLSIDLSIYRSIDLSIYRSIDLSIYRSIDLSIYRSIDLSI